MRPPEHESPDRVWRIVNKYYTALVRVQARAEGDVAVAAGLVGAQLVLLAHDELQAATAERRLQDAGAAAVNVLVCDAPAVPDELLALCARRHLEPVALREPDPDPAIPFPDLCGLLALRTALHANTWSSLSLVPPRAEEAEEDDCVRDVDELQAQRYAHALEALGSAAALTTGLHGSERREAAEQLVAAFAAAIGHPLDLDNDDLDLDL